jgi:hypothetical protein
LRGIAPGLNKQTRPFCRLFFVETCVTTSSFRTANVTSGLRMSWSAVLGLVALNVAASTGMATRANAADPRAMIELFTSQGCSSCPAADKLLGELATDPSIITVSLPIDYWDYLGWKDTLADARFSARQRAYSKMRGDRDVYTPQVVINGKLHMIGSDRANIEKAISETARQAGVMSLPVKVTRTKGQLNVSVTSGADLDAANRRGEVWISSIAKAVPIAIGRGENRGREVVYHNVVRNWLKVGDWNGQSGSWTVPIENVARDGVDGAVVYVQDGSRDKPGAMLGAAYVSLR